MPSRSNDELVLEVARKAPSYLGGLPRSGRVLDAMRKVDRALFLPESRRAEAYRDEPVPIGYGQTCSQPSMVALMADLLEPRPGCKLLEVGAGSGYAAAIISLLVAPGGRYYALELREGLYRGLRERFAVPGSIVEPVLADGSHGYPQAAPYDAILLSAGVRLPFAAEADLLAQLSIGGVLLYPEERGSLHRLRKLGGGIERDEYPGVAFVPLVGA
jgi:protein-L-isoaspartate(D-aspartate) O-methyltransferase